MTDDLLVTVRKKLDARNGLPQGWDSETVAALLDRCTTAEGLLTHWQNRYAALEAKWDDLRQRHAEAVEQAFREALPLAVCNVRETLVLSADAAWFASEAKARLRGCI